MKFDDIISEYEKNIDKLESDGIRHSTAKDIAKKMLEEKYNGDTKVDTKALVDIKDYDELYKALYKDKGPVKAFQECADKIKKEKSGTELYNEMTKLVAAAKDDYAKIGKPLHWEHTDTKKNEDGSKVYSKVSYTYMEDNRTSDDAKNWAASNYNTRRFDPFEFMWRNWLY